MEMMTYFWGWLKIHDLPNWIAVVIWPIVLFAWSQHEVSYISNLEVSLSKGPAKIGDQEMDALWLNFLNNTGSIVYLTNARILKCSKLFQVDPLASRDIAESSHELKFLNTDTGYLTERQIILQTNEEKGSCLSLKNSITDEMLTYRPNWLRKMLYRPKYFLLKYTVMVGNMRYKVSTIY